MDANRTMDVNRTMRPIAGLLAMLLLATLAPQVQAQDPVARPVATETASGVEVERASYPVLGTDGTELGTADWRVVTGTGNCCEHYLATTATGRILDFGGTYLHLSDDRGETWRRVQTPIPYVAGEGAVSAAPGGDIVGVGWTAYTGDQLWAHKYEADEEQWYYAPIPVHSPFHDRPWIAVVPGPIGTGLGQGDYAVLLQGYPTHRAIQASLDGLTYDQPTNQHHPLQGDGQAPAPTPDPVLDWVQPNRQAQITPLGDGQAIGPSWIDPCGQGQQAILDPDLLWRCQATPFPATGLVTDGKGRLHHVQAQAGAGTVTYRVSPDGGQTWAKVDAELPDGLTVGELRAVDLAASGAQDQAVVAIHAVDTSVPAHQDLVLRFDLALDQPRHRETLFLGDGDHLFGSNVASTGPRFDFASIALLPDGRIVASFADAAHQDSPALAVELPGTEPREAGTNGSQTGDDGDGRGRDPGGHDGQEQAPPVARFSLEADGWNLTADASGSWDPDGNVTAYRWGWGDGATGHGAKASHRYTQPGSYTITLTVTDDDGLTSRTDRTASLTLEETLDPAAEDPGSQAIPGPGLLAAVAAGLAAGIAARRRRRSL